MYRSLSDFIALLEKEGELIRISAPVDPILEIAELTDRQAKSPGGGRALLFENTGTEFPVVTNMMGSQRRISMALGVDSIDDITRRIDSLLGSVTSPKAGIMDKLRMLPLLSELSHWMPRNKSGRGECQSVVMRGDQVDLESLPILKCWPGDGGRFVTLPLVHTLDAESGARNVGMYRMQIFDRTTAAMHWHTHKTGERHYRQYKALGQRMPVAVCLGGDPAYTYAATAPLPDGIDEYILAGFLRRRAVNLVRCVTSEIRVPTDCDIVIEGYIDPTEDKILEGDFGDHTGFYSLQDLYPRFHVTCITHRRGAIYPATLVGVPPQEDAWIGWATERIFLQPIRFAVAPEVVDLWMPTAGVAHNLVVCVIAKSYAGQAFKVANALWGAGQMGFNKYMIVLSSDTVPTAAGTVTEAETRERTEAEAATSGVGDTVDYTALIRQRLHYFDPGLDVLFSRGVLDVLDHSAPALGFGGKLCLDLTSKEGFPQEGIRSRSASIPVDVLFDDAVTACDGLSFDDMVWLAVGNSDPMRDVSVSDNILHIDARIKTLDEPQGSSTPATRRLWPRVVAMSPAVVEAVDARWDEYGLPEMIESPSRRYWNIDME